MAAGDGFKQVPFGFDKNEVNTYISDLRKKMNALEADMRKNDEKTRAAEKLAEEADDRIKAAAAADAQKIAELTAQLEEERSTTERQLVEIRNLKDRIDAEKKKMTDMLKNGKGVSAEATRAFNEVIDKANEDAAAIIEKANKKAEDIIAAAKQQRGEITAKSDAFLHQLREQLEVMNSGYNAVNQTAAELLGTEPAAAVTLPEVQPVIAPAAPAAPVFEAEPEEAPADIAEEPAAEEQSEPVQQEETVSEPEEVQPEAEPVSEPEPAPAEEPASEEETDDLFSGDWSGNQMAEAVEAAERKAAEESKQDIPLVNPDAGKNLFGGDLFNMDDNSDDMNGFDMGKTEEPESVVDKVEPLDVADHAEASYDKDFDKDLLAQTMSSSSLANDADDDLLAAVKAAEEAFAVQPNDVSEIDMDEQPEAAADPASEEDELMRALREAEEALNNVKDSADSSASEPEEEAPSAEDPWADLQKQLEAMESANGAGSAVTYDEPEPVQQEQEEPQAAPPSADDSSIWDFGSGSGSSDNSDDDMSGDFGGFGGF